MSEALAHVAAVEAGPPPGWVRGADLLANGKLFPGHDDRGHKLRRVAKGLAPAGLAQLHSGEWYFSPTNECKPDGTNSVPAIMSGTLVRDAWLDVKVGFDPNTTSSRAVAKVAAILVTNVGFREFMRERRLQNRREAWPLYRTHRGPAWFKDNKVPKNHSQFELWINDLIPNGKVEDARGGHERAASISPEAWQLFLSLLGSANSIKLAQAHRFVEGEAKDRGWLWPSETAVCAQANGIPSAALVLRREGDRQFEARCVPKVSRDLSLVLAGEVWSLDTRTLDWPCRVPDARSEWRAARLSVCGVADCRSRSLKVTLRATEHSDGILAGLKDAMLDWGAPTDIICDNGKGYIAALLGSSGVESFCETFGITLHRAIAYHAWAKQIEAIWNRLKEYLDRWLPVFVGGSPDERPQDRTKEHRKDIMSLPTEEEANGWLQEAIDGLQATEITGSGTLGLTPNLIFEQFCGPIRSVDPALANVYCRRCIGPIPKTQRGLRLNHLYYGRWDEAVWRLPDGEYYLLKDAGTNDQVIVAGADKKPICVATNRMLRGTTDEDRREAARLQAHYRRVMREAVPARDYIRQTPVQQILAAKTRHAKARESELRSMLPEQQLPPVAIVRADLVEPARKVLAASATADVKAARCEASAQPSQTRRRGFERLAEKGRLDEMREAAAVQESQPSPWSRLNYETGAAG